MLRQIFIFHNQKLIFQHSLALALGKDDLKNVINLIKSHMIMPMQKTFQSPFKSYQIFHSGMGSTYFLIVADLVDTYELIDNILKKIIKKFKELFSNLDIIEDLSDLKSQFLEFLYENQKDLHTKITIIGPLNSGKTTLYNMLKSGEDRAMMNFAKLNVIQIDGLTFDIWDFLIQDDFSILWSKFIGSSDLILLLFDSKNFNSKLVDHFVKLKVIDGKFSRILIIANKHDLINDVDFENLKSQLNIPDLKKLSLINQNGKLTLIQMIRESLNLKKKLPPNFNDLIKDADKLNIDGKLTESIEKYEELIIICEASQESEYIVVFETKIEELKNKMEKKVETKRQLERKKKFSAPDQIKFTQKIMVKELPKKNSVAIKVPQKTPIKSKPKPTLKKIPLSELSAIGPELKPKKLTLRPQDVKLNIKLNVGNKKKVEKQVDKGRIQIKKIDIKNSLKPIKNIERVNIEKVQIEELDLEDQLKSLIKDRGVILNPALCNKFIEELSNNLENPLTMEDIETAAEVFCSIEKKI